MITDVGSHLESEIRMNDDELIRFCKLFSQAELHTLINILYWTGNGEYYKNEITFAEKVLETEKLNKGYNFNYINITKKVDLLTDKELMFLHTVAEDANFYINNFDYFGTLFEDFCIEHAEIAEKLENDVTEEIEERISTGKFIEVPPVAKTKVIKP